MYDIKAYTKARAREYGVQIRPSTNIKKKIDVFKDGKKIASIGSIGYKDFPTYTEEDGPVVAERRRKAYRIRHEKDRHSGNGFWADRLLW
jgi:hypothetical protein